MFLFMDKYEMFIIKQKDANRFVFPNQLKAEMHSLTLMHVATFV